MVGQRINAWIFKKNFNAALDDMIKVTYSFDLEYIIGDTAQQQIKSVIAASHGLRNRVGFRYLIKVNTAYPNS